jgi:YD repeat-containing protein
MMRWGIGTTNGSTHNAGNQLTADANFAYQYDDNGNLIRKTLLATGNYTQYTYDAENRLTQGCRNLRQGIRLPSRPAAIGTMGWGDGSKRWPTARRQRYIYDGEDILLEYDGSNVLQARYTHGPGIDEPLEPDADGAGPRQWADRPCWRPRRMACVGRWWMMGSK